MVRYHGLLNPFQSLNLSLKYAPDWIDTSKNVRWVERSETQQKPITIDYFSCIGLLSDIYSVWLAERIYVSLLSVWEMLRSLGRFSRKKSRFDPRYK